MRRHIKRRVISMEPSAGRTIRGNPQYWMVTYACGHEEMRGHYGYFWALYYLLHRGVEIQMCCGKCD